MNGWGRMSSGGMKRKKETGGGGGLHEETGDREGGMREKVGVSMVSQ